MLNILKASFESFNGNTLKCLIVLFVISLWMGMLMLRTVQKSVLIGIKILYLEMALWITIRGLKSLTEGNSLAERYLWYSFYFCMFAIALCMLWIAHSTDIEEDRTLIPIWLRIVMNIDLVLFLLVMTNEFHQKVFVLILEDGVWKGEYTYGWGYCIVAVMLVGEIILSQIMLIYKAYKHLQKRYFVWFIAYIVMLISYAVCYILRVEIVYKSNMTLVFCVMCVTYLQVCLSTGLIQANSMYRELFKKSPLAMMICDNRGRVYDRADVEIDATKAQLEYLKKEECKIQRGDRILHSRRIAHGMIIWQENVGSINRMYKELVTTIERLRNTNELLKKEEIASAATDGVLVQKSIIEDMNSEIADKLEILKRNVALLPEMANPKEATVKLTLLVCYIKRRCNMYFIQMEQEYLKVSEVAVFIDELADIAALAGIKCINNCQSNEVIPITQAIMMYEFFYESMLVILNNDCTAMFTNIDVTDDEIAVRIMPSAKFIHKNPGEDFKKQIEALDGKIVTKITEDTCGIWLLFRRKQTNAVVNRMESEA